MRPRTLYATFTAVLVAAVLAVPGVADATEAAQPLRQAHAHNDYEHDRPLYDALDHGFTSVEADVWLVGGELLVAHDLVDVDPTRTLQSLYLDPLSKLVEENDGSVYPGDKGRVQLLIDVKSEARSTYAALDEVLKQYPKVMTHWHNGQVKKRAVDAVVSGNRALDVMTGQRVRYAGYDGRLSDLGSGLRPTLMPLVSDNWTNQFSWLGEGPMPPEEREKLRSIVATAHDHGYLLRFWATPDEAGPARDAMWTELRDAGVDYINTDDLAGLQDFLTGDTRQEAAA